ncbi:MAG: hypothetical protein CVV27_02300 [Candidatus Melainabacteria bacterium HGW-Melainabacteria-1]|nr:MAG: hypothetical protein CVV27_02300 [Candidatus Melainabacteria bacterium HGW-Melainabacteria-1]
MIRPALLKAFALASAWPYRRLEAALADPRAAQLATLKRLLRLANVDSAIQDYAAFCQLPLLSYEDIGPRIEAALTAGQGWLSRRAPVMYEPTSGSSGAAKLIPYTPALLRSFTSLFLCWAHDLLSQGPALKGGRIYFSVSPQFHASGHGLADDSEYLTGPSSWLFKHFTLVPPGIKALSDPEDFFRVLALYLLAAEDLEVISVWSPSYLLAVLDYINGHRQELAEGLLQPTVTAGGRSFVLPRARRLKAELLKTEPLPWTGLFPALKLISCWGAGNAQPGFRQLQLLFPRALVQAKGLLATEAPISFPSLKYGAFLPLLTEVFFEFIDAQGQVLFIDQLEHGQSYELVISQASGLLRYRLGDRIQVTGRVGQTPCFDFVARGEAVCDLVGEKLNEAFVATVAARFGGNYLFLVPDPLAACYVLFASAPIDTEAFEAGLMASPHYHNARQLRQLRPLQGGLLPELAVVIKQFFVQRRQMRLGDIKDRFLYPRELDGELLAWLRA